MLLHFCHKQYFFVIYKFLSRLLFTRKPTLFITYSFSFHIRGNSLALKKRQMFLNKPHDKISKRKPLNNPPLSVH